MPALFELAYYGSEEAVEAVEAQKAIETQRQEAVQAVVDSFARDQGIDFSFVKDSVAKRPGAGSGSWQA